MLIHKPTQKVVLRLSEPGRVTTVIPTAKRFDLQGVELVAVPHRLDETRVLRNLGFDVPSPIREHYGWPGQFKPFHAQLDTADFLTMNKRAFCLNDMGCVDADTEYLTPTGWRRIADYESGPVAQYNPHTKAIEFVEPEKFVKLPCADMIRIKTKYGLDQLLSPEHRVLLYAKGNPEKQEVVQAVELLGRHDAWVAGKRLAKSHDKIGWTQAAIPVTFGAPGGAGLALSADEIRLQIAVIADGHFPNNTRRCVVRLKKERKIARLRKLLVAAGVTYSEKDQLSTGFQIFSFEAPTRDKEFSGAWWGASKAQLNIIADEVMHWDGSVSDSKSTERFSTFVKASADFIQYVFSGIGRTARVTETRRHREDRACEEIEYTVSVRDNGRPLMLASISSNGERHSTMSVCPSTDGFKYCFMVQSTFLLFRRNGCIFASGNTGKTLAALWAFDYLKSIGAVNRALVISPLSTLDQTWAAEVFRNFPHLNTATLHGSKDRRVRMLNTPADIYLLNHDGVVTMGELIEDRKDIDLIIIDEVATFRNSGTLRWKALHKIVRKRQWVWGLTGTPTPNSPLDAWAQCRLISPERVPSYHTKFRDQVMRQVGPFQWLPREGATDAVAEAMQPAIRFSRADCVDLPPCINIERHAEMSPDQKRHYKDMLTKLKAEAASQQIVAVNEAVKLGKLVQIACGAVYSNTGETIKIEAASRLDVVEEVIEQAATKAIVFVPYRGVLEYVAGELAARGHDVATIDGSTPKGERDRIFSAFQHTPQYQVLVAQPAAMSHGLTLTAASAIIWWAPITSHEVEAQANARVSRPGQKHTQLLVRISGSPVERKLYDRLSKRSTMQGALLEILRDL